ncbi:MAG: PD-(D/E)XK nuclease family protein, partial [Elusimicrobia bacterium]|nr:PD-(D/E)XK nuclease family protein [Elusimicrobiota bacterium]
MNIKNILTKAQDKLKWLVSFIMRGQVTMSNSRLNTYSTCPMKYEFSYEKGLRGFPSAPLHFGSAIHDALQTFHSRFDLKGEQGTLDELIKDFEKAWEKGKESIITSVAGPPVRRWIVALSESGATDKEIEETLKRFETIYASPEEEQEYKDRGLNMLEEYFRDNQTNENKIIALEKQLTITKQG